MEKESSSITRPALEEIAQGCLCLQVRQTARAVTQWYDACLQPSGLRSTQVNLMVAIALAQTVPLTRLAELLVLDRTSLARNLKPLEREGLVEVSPGEDKRVRLIRLTEGGYQRLAQALPYWKEAQDQMIARLGSLRWETMHADLRDLQMRVPDIE
jgi:DNA-binding MarR family transcriptional regulator